MNRKKLKINSSIIYALSAFLIVFILFQFLYQTDNKYTAGAPYGKDGNFSFSDSDLSQKGVLFLIDGWEIYPDTLLTPEDIRTDNAPDSKTVFIGQHPNFSFFSSKHSPFGKATYCMTLDYSGSSRILTLELPEIFTTYTLYIDGQKVAPQGSSIPFLADGPTNIMLAVENESHYYSGLTYPPAVGTPDAVGQMLFLRYLFYSILCLFPLSLCLYAVAAWFSRNRSSRFAHFGLLCLFFSIHCAHPFIHQLGLNSTLWYALEDVSWLAVLYEVIALCTIEAGWDGKRWYRNYLRPFALGISILCACCVLFILPNFGEVINFYGHLLDIYKFICWLYLLTCAILGMTSGKLKTNLILCGGGALGAAITVNLLDNNRFEPIYTGWQTEYAGFFLVLIFWFLTILHIKELIYRNELLTERLEEEVQKQTAQLHAVLDERKTFFSDLAHNLKAPMVAIHGFTDLILKGNIHLDDDLRGYMNKIYGANEELCRRMQVLGNLNAFDKIKEQPEYLNVDELLFQVYTDNEPETTISGILLHVKKIGVPVFLYGTKQKLLLLFENLIYNALSFTPEDGMITIFPRLEGNDVVIDVTDTGSGIAPEHLPHIFERFYVARENKNEGSGLGLYIVQITIAELNGSISVESTVGEGTTFTIRLPVTAR